MSEKNRYIQYLERGRIKDKVILLESQHGKSFGGNIAALTKELAGGKEYRRFKVYVSCKKGQMASLNLQLQRLGVRRAKLVEMGSREYYKLLATAKYLINDNTFILDYIKRPEQVYLNTWHGTPLKTLGNKIGDDYGMIGNAQRNFICADYLLCPNEFTLKCLTEDYMIENLGNTKLLLTGYPRNTAFFDKERAEKIRQECELDGMEAYAYLPTWRGISSQVASEQQNEQLMEYFKELDEALEENQRVYVKLHPLNSKGVNLTSLKHIVPFPTDYETYEFLNATDGLITDYSSIFFDYAITGKKIILFTYDKEEYTSSRGFYFSMDELPFPQAATVAELVRCINTPKNYDDRSFVKKYCAYDNPDVTRALCHRMLFGEESALIKEKNLKDNGKKNVLLYAGPLATNRTTEAFLELAAGLDTRKYNFTLIYKMEEVKYRQKRLKQLPEGINYMGFYEAYSLPEDMLEQYKTWRDAKKAPETEEEQKSILSLKQHEKQRLFTKCRVDYVLDFSGSNDETVLVLSEFPMSRIKMSRMAKPINKQLTGVLSEEVVEIENAGQVMELLDSKFN